MIRITSVWAASVAVFGISGLSLFIFGCSHEQTYKFEEKGWDPPVYGTVSEMVTRSSLCQDSFTTWLVIMMVFVLGAILWTALVTLPGLGWRITSTIGFVVAVSGVVIIIRHPHKAQSAWWDWHQRVAAGSQEPYVEPNYDSSHHDIGAGLIFAGLFTVLVSVTGPISNLLWVSSSHVAWSYVIWGGWFVCAFSGAMIFVSWETEISEVYPWEYLFLYVLIITAAAGGWAAPPSPESPYTAFRAVIL